MPTDDLAGPQLEFFTAINCKIAFNWLMSKKEIPLATGSLFNTTHKRSSPSVEKPSIVTQFSSVMNNMSVSHVKADPSNNLFEDLFN